jgi:hypothetical protein
MHTLLYPAAAPAVLAAPAADRLEYILKPKSPIPTKWAISASTNRVSWSSIVLQE